jgi:predicted 2-oxoglutarate/Fe(II)-dependent dioxygenase YbiX
MLNNGKPGSVTTTKRSVRDAVLVWLLKGLHQCSKRQKLQMEQRIAIQRLSDIHDANLTKSASDQ